MRAFVTGAAGFVGRHLVPRLEAAGYAVTATDVELDVSDPDKIAAALADVAPDVVIHLAAVSSVPHSRRDPTLTYRVNYLGALSLLSGVEQHVPDARILLIGSSEMYGFAQSGAAPFDEASPLRPESPYALTKAAADLLGAAYADTGLDVVRVRPFNHSGPGQADTFVLASFARQAVEIALGRRDPLLEVGNLDSVRDFLDVDDVVDAYVRLADGVPPGTYNVASGSGIRVGEALDGILQLAAVADRVEVRVDPQRLRPADYTVGDASRLRDATGWKPEVPLERMLARLVDDWRDRLHGAGVNA